MNKPSQLKIRKFKSEDFSGLGECLATLQDYVAKLDPFKIYLPREKFDTKTYTKNSIEDMEKEDGVIFVALLGKEIVGAVIGSIMKQTPEALIEKKAIKKGMIWELVVLEGNRGHGIGTQLLETIENYFKEKGCDHIGLDVKWFNTNAHKLYQKNGYIETTIHMLKKV